MKEKRIKGFQDQVRVTAAGKLTILDFLVTTKKNKRIIFEAKSSETAPLTRNQKQAFPAIKTTGYTLEKTGQAFPKTPISIIRPKTLDKKGVLERMLDQ